METINSLIESFYYRLFLVASHEGESIQPYYRHNHEEAENYYQQRAQELLEENDTIPLLDIDELIWERDISFPEPEEFASILQTEDQNFETPISQKSQNGPWMRIESFFVNYKCTENNGLSFPDRSQEEAPIR